jgi:hypothetical protein
MKWLANKHQIIEMEQEDSSYSVACGYDLTYEGFYPVCEGCGSSLETATINLVYNLYKDA